MRHLIDSFLNHVDSVAICAEAAYVSNVGCEIGQTQNEFQFHTSMHPPRSLMLAQIKQLPQLWVLLLHWLVQEVSPPQVVLL